MKLILERRDEVFQRELIVEEVDGDLEFFTGDEYGTPLRRDQVEQLVTFLQSWLARPKGGIE